MVAPRRRLRRALGVLALSLSLSAAPALALEDDSFTGTVIDETNWLIVDPAGSSVTQNDALFVTSNDQAFEVICNQVDLFGPGAGVAARLRLAGDFEIAVDYSGFTASGQDFSQAFLNVFQDVDNQLSIKRILGTSADGIQSVAKVGGAFNQTGVTPGGAAGTFRITRAGSTLRTFEGAGGTTLHHSIGSAFTGEVLVSLMLLSPLGGSASVVWDDFDIVSGTIVGPEDPCLPPVDTTPPTLGPCPPAGPFVLNSGPQAVGPIDADDLESGIDAGESTLTASVDTSTVGAKTVTFTAVDNVGLTTTLDCDYAVHYVFEGFFDPIDDSGTNLVKAGQTVPIKWRLSDALGQPVDDPASFVGVTVTPTPSSCGGEGGFMESAAGNSGLQYLGDGFWQFNWKTPKAYAGECRTMSLDLNDGATDRTAEFEFK